MQFFNFLFFPSHSLCLLLLRETGSRLHTEEASLGHYTALYLRVPSQPPKCRHHRLLNTQHLIPQKQHAADVLAKQEVQPRAAFRTATNCHPGLMEAAALFLTLSKGR